MKRIIAFLCCLFLITSISPSASATHSTTDENIVFYSQSDLGNGLVVIDEVIECTNARSANKTYERKKTLTYNGTTVGIIAIRGTFSYDGSTVSVVSKSVTQTDTYDGWSYKQNSFSSSGGTITLDAKLTKLLVMNIPFTMTLTCDKDGNISYT